MADGSGRTGQLIIYRDEQPERGLGRAGGLPRISGWAALAVVIIGGVLMLNGLLGLLLTSLDASYARAGGTGLAGVYLVQLAFGVGLIMRKELARRVYLVFATLGLVLMLVSAASSASHMVNVVIDAATLGLLLHPDVKRAFD